jgi:hypothetical protein
VEDPYAALSAPGPEVRGCSNFAATSLEELAFGGLRKHELFREGLTMKIDITRTVPRDPGVLYSR